MSERLENIPLKDILMDEEWNVRDSISITDIRDLAKDIKANGLFTPIIVRPYGKDGYAYKIVAGHRRYKACKYNKAETIKCLVRDDLSDLNATIINFSENVQRKDLNIAEEAKGVTAMILSGMSEKDIAARIGRSKTWVSIRVALTHLPIEIQREAAAGFLKQEDIRELSKIKSDKARFSFVHQLKSRKIKNEKEDTIFGIKQKNKQKQNEKNKRKIPTTAEIFEIQDIVYSTLGPGLVTRAFAYTAGEISAADFMLDLQTELTKYGKNYIIPPRFRQKFKV